MGHEFSGVVSAVGPDCKKFKVGDHVIPEPLVVCGQCPSCKSGNMRPFIRKNKDTVTVIPLFDEPQVGDIVLFRAKRLGGDYVLHRVYQINGEKIRTFGDGCLTPDEWLSRDVFIGIAVTIQRGKKVIDCGSPKWKRISALWVKLLPIRRYLLRLASIKLFR